LAFEHEIIPNIVTLKCELPLSQQKKT